MNQSPKLNMYLFIIKPAEFQLKKKCFKFHSPKNFFISFCCYEKHSVQNNHHTNFKQSAISMGPHRDSLVIEYYFTVIY